VVRTDPVSYKSFLNGRAVDDFITIRYIVLIYCGLAERHTFFLLRANIEGLSICGRPTIFKQAFVLIISVGIVRGGGNVYQSNAKSFRVTFLGPAWYVLPYPYIFVCTESGGHLLPTSGAGYPTRFLEVMFGFTFTVLGHQ